MREDKERQNKLTEIEENADAPRENANEQARQSSETDKHEKNIKKFLWHIVFNGCIQAIVGIVSSGFSTVGLLILQLLYLFVMAERYKLDFIKILIDLIIKSTHK